MENKNHWYDGAFYDKLIAPNQDSLFARIKELIEPNSKILDVGCGTGRLGFFLSDKCKTITGIDLSEKNIQRAKLNLQRNSCYNISFEHIGLEDYVKNNSSNYDYAVLTYVIHEVPEEDRVKLLTSISGIAKKIIIGDYLVPRPNGFWSLLNELVEFAAGSEHYRNYKSFVTNGGINYIASKVGLKIIIETKNQPSTSHLVILTK